MLPLAVAAGLLSACSGEPEADKQDGNALPKELAGELSKTTRPIAADIGSPMEERVATIGVLNKRNNLSEDLKLKPGEAKRVGNVIVKLAACERTAPWEKPPETGAFVQVLVQQRATVEEPLRWHRIFSGWLFKNSPSLNVVEHPIYDVWVKDCAMNFPGEETPPGSSSASAGTTPAVSSAAAQPAAPAAGDAAPAPAAASTPANPSGSEDQGEPR